MKYLIILFMIFLLGCGNKTITTKIAENTKKQIESVNKEITVSSCKIEEKIRFQQSLEIIKNNIDNIELSCKTEKQILNEKINKLKIIIGAFIVILIMFLYFNLKRR